MRRGLNRSGRTFRRESLSLCLVTDREMCAARGVVETVRLALVGGATMVQLRDKTASTEELIDLARALVAAAKPYGAPVVVNDAVEVAVAASAQGAHIGQGDGDPAVARALLGPEAILGLSVENMDQARLVDPSVVDYVGVSPVWATPTKPDHAPALGLESAAEVAGRSRCPAVGIGGVGPGRADALIAAGFDGAAVVSAICAAVDPQAAARALRREIETARGERND